MLKKNIEEILMKSEQNGWGYEGMALSRNSLIHLCSRLEDQEKVYHILELGGGQSTLFWKYLSFSGLLKVKVTTLEHDNDWATQLSTHVEDLENITVYSQTLKQVTDEEWEKIFSHPQSAHLVWKSYGKEVPQNQYNFFSIHNAFYAEVDQLALEQQSFDIMILDGPHGNGRSLAYPLFCNCLKSDALLLIDDFDHYPFLEDLHKIFHYEEIHRQAVGEKRWVLVQLQGRKICL